MGRRLTLALLFLWAPVATAQNVYGVRLEAQPLMYSARGVVYGCGVRMFGVSDSLNEAVDLSINVYYRDSRLFGVFKIASKNVAIDSARGMPTFTDVPVREAWIKTEGAAPLSPISSPSTGEDGASILYVVSAEDAAKLIVALFKGSPPWIGVSRKGAPTERVYTGSIIVPVHEAQRINACVQELLG